MVIVAVIAMIGMMMMMVAVIAMMIVGMMIVAVEIGVPPRWWISLSCRTILSHGNLLRPATRPQLVRFVLNLS